MTKASFFQQLFALLKRNYNLKKRRHNQTLQEIFMPVYCVLLLAVFKKLASPQKEPVISNFPSYDLGSDSFYPRSISSKLYVSPNTSYVRNIMDEVLQENAIWSNVKNVYFSTSNESEASYRQKPSSVKAGVDFSMKENDTEVEYTIRIPYTKIAQTKPGYIFKYDTGQCLQRDGLDRKNCEANTYVFSEFAQLQSAIDTVLIKGKSPSFTKPSLSVEMLPRDTHVPSIQRFQVIVAVCFVMAYSPFISFLTINMVWEKERKIKEGMRMMGMSDSAFWASWGITYGLIILVATILITVIVAVAQFFPNSNLFIIFVVLLLYGLTIINMAFMITPFFNKAETAGTVAGCTVAVFSLCYMLAALAKHGHAVGAKTHFPIYAQYGLGLLSPVAFAFALDQGVYLDMMKGGINFNTTFYGDAPLIGYIVMLAIDWVLYGLLAAYLDNVIPTNYGQRRKLLFCFSKLYWCPRKTFNPEESYLMDDARDECEEQNVPAGMDSNVEPVQTELNGKNYLRIYDICKVFKETYGAVCKRSSVGVDAVNGLSLDIYEGQITALLGHNGAGKSTLINMLTGMTQPSSGTATIYGLDVSSPDDMNVIRSMTGVCPQHNILFDELTCREHLEVYGSLKGVSASSLKTKVEHSLKDVDLYDQADKLAEKLSGGQKRKLSVAIALIGDPKVIFLDEPTAGMDPNSRHQVWSLLKARKKGRIILLTTHFMDEADILADRKAIMSKGKLRCCGSSLYLKNKFGLGYHLGLSVRPEIDVPTISDIVFGHVEGSSILRHQGQELVFNLPLKSVHQFSGLFQLLEEADLPTYGIESYGVSMTTLESVFLKLGDAEELIEEEEAQDHANQILPLLDNLNNSRYDDPNVRVAFTQIDNTSSNIDFRPTESHKPNKRLRDHQFFKLVGVQFLTLKRNLGNLCLKICLPAVIILLGSLLTKYTKFESMIDDLPKLNLTGSIYAATSSPSSLPSLLYLTDATSAFKEKLVEQGYKIDSKPTNTSLLDVAPHFIGLRNNMEQGERETDFTILYNSSAIHSIPAAINMIYTAMAGKDIKIKTNNQPWPTLEIDTIYLSVAQLSSALLIGMSLVMVPATFTVNVVKEKENKVKGQLLVSGVSYTTYWGSMFLSDILQYSVICLLVVTIPIILQNPTLMNYGAILSLIALFITYMPVTILLAYILSFTFHKHTTAQVVLSNILPMAVFLPFLIISFLPLIVPGFPVWEMHLLFSVIDPWYTAIGCIFKIDQLYREAVVKQIDLNPTIPIEEYFGRHILFTYLSNIFHCIWLCLLLGVLERQSSTNAKCWLDCMKRNDYHFEDNALEDEEDSEVIEERKLVEKWDGPGASEDAMEPVVVVKNLRKEFCKTEKTPACVKCCLNQKQKQKVAVKNNSFMVKPGEVFGLLGPNGAGKTTTINMVIGECKPTHGEVYVAGKRVDPKSKEAFRELGYCPQHNALWDYITVEEHIKMYSAIKGLPEFQAEGLVRYFTEALRMEAHKSKITKHLSGGTKRKLSYSLSMIGDPRVVLMDEPSTGLDPKSKRSLWNTIISNFQNDRRGAILITHQLEEADALCSRMGIMVNGKMKCIGSSQHLKDKFGKFYLFEVKLLHREDFNADQIEERIHQLTCFVSALFPDAIEVEAFDERFLYKIPMRNVIRLSKVFNELERGKSTHGIEEYSFSQSTLEQVFLEFAKDQKEEGSEFEYDDYQIAPNLNGAIV